MNKRLIDTDNSMVVTTGEGDYREKKVKGAKYMETNGDLTVGGEHTMQYIDDVFIIQGPAEVKLV